MQLDDIDLIMGTLETSIGSIGGFCVGTTYVVEHQTLAGLGNLANFIFVLSSCGFLLKNI